VRTAGDQRDILTGEGQLRTHESSDSTCADDADPHCLFSLEDVYL
jgi:hypothetical protein